MGGFRAAGDVGFLLGVVTAGLLVETLLAGGEGDPMAAYSAVFVGFGGMHLAITLMALPVLARSGGDRVET